MKKQQQQQQRQIKSLRLRACSQYTHVRKLFQYYDEYVRAGPHFPIPSFTSYHI